VTSAEPQLPRAAARIAIVEDDTVLGQALAQTVGQVEGFEFVGLAETLRDGLKLLEQRIDVLLVDLALPDGSGLDLITLAHQKLTCKILVISVFGDVRNVVRAIECGADGYLLKGADTLEVATAIRTVLAGGAPISPAVAGHILSRVRGTLSLAEKEPKPAVTLTPKEVVILEHLAKGLSFKEVARLEDISHHTVGDHVKAIYRKLAVNSRSEAVFEAVQAGLIRLRD
jgi:DNA-binding NarL/FixJ family response regulator